MAHFIEHVIFKGTARRKAYHILSRMEDVGGELNAYTTKEDTCIYASFLSKDYARAIELFSDIVFNSVFPEREMEKEKEVVIDEINSYKDTPSELIFDDFEELVYRGESIGRNILGSEEHVRQLRREQILDFVRRNYVPKRMVVSSVGDIDFAKLVRLVERYFGGVTGGDAPVARIKPALYQPRFAEVNRDTFQSHCIIGNVAYDYRNEKRLALSMLVELLGGSGMNSRLNLHIREKYGLAYDVEAAFTPYSDTGLFTVYFGCDADDTLRCRHLCEREMKRLCDNTLRPGQIRKMKVQTEGQLTLSAENYENTMLSIGKSFLVYDRVDTIEEICARVEEVDAALLRQVAEEVFDIGRQSVLVYK